MNCEQCPAFDHAVRKSGDTCLTASGGILGLVEFKGKVKPVYLTHEELVIDEPELVEEWQRCGTRDEDTGEEIVPLLCIDEDVRINIARASLQDAVRIG